MSRGCRLGKFVAEPVSRVGRAGAGDRRGLAVGVLPPQLTSFCCNFCRFSRGNRVISLSALAAWGSRGGFLTERFLLS